MEPSLNTVSGDSLSSSSFNFCYIAPLDSSIALGRVPLHTVIKDAFQGASMSRYKGGEKVNTIAIEVKTSNLSVPDLYISGALQTGEINALSSFSRYKLEPDDVMISARFATFAAAYFSESDPKFVNKREALSITNPDLPAILVATSNTILLRPNQAVISAEYLTLWLRREQGREAIDSASKRVTGKSQFAKDS